MHQNNSDTKTKILDIAYNLFARQGYAATSIRQIANECVINLSMIGYYFGGKEGLYRAIVDMRIKQVIKDITEDIVQENDIHKRVEIFANRLMDSLTSDSPNILTIVTRELVSHDQSTAYITTDIITNFTKLFDAIFEGTDTERPDYSDATSGIYDIFGIIAPIYFYSISQPLLDKYILLDESEIKKFRKKLVDDVCQKANTIIK
jgi:AcrR family transcriptional regulator